MSKDGAERRKRLMAMREKAGKSAPTLKFRNYRPQDASIKQSKSGRDDDIGTNKEDKTVPGDKGGNGRERTRGRGRGTGDNGDEGTAEDEDDEQQRKRRAPTESLIQQELKKQKEVQDEEELNIAPKKVNWDLKRDVEKKLEKLDRRTQRAIVEIIRERMAEEAANASSGSESGSEEESGSENGEEEESGSSSDED